MAGRLETELLLLKGKGLGKELLNLAQLQTMGFAEKISGPAALAFPHLIWANPCSAKDGCIAFRDPWCNERTDN